MKILKSQNIKTSAIGSLAITFFSTCFSLLNGILLARSLGVENYGIYVLSFTTVTLLSIPVSLGLPTLITRYISKYEVHNDYSSIKGLLIKTNQFVWVSFAIVLAGAGILYFIWWHNLNKSLVDTLWCGFFLLPMLAFGSLRSAALRGLRYIIIGQLPDTLLRNFLFCLGIVIWYYILKLKFTAPLAMMIQIVAAGISFIVGQIFLKNKLLNILKPLKPAYSTKEWFNQSIPFSINSGVQIVKFKLLTYVLASFGSIQAVAYFDIADRGATLVSYTLTALNTAIAPYISASFEKNDLQSLQKIVTKTSRIIFVCALPVALGFIIGGERLIGLLFGNEYKLSYIPLVILCIGQLVNALTGSTGLVLNMTGNQKYFTNTNVLITLINVVISIPMVKFFDVTGAAIAYSALLILQNVILYIYVQNKFKLNTTVFSTIK